MNEVPQTLPKTVPEWLAYVSECRLTDKTIHTPTVLSSASKIGLHQFLLLRVLWIPHRKPQPLYQHLDLQDRANKAKQFLDQYSSWKTYCDNLHSSTHFPEGTFALARHYQLEVQHTKKDIDLTAFASPIKTRAMRRAEKQQEGIRGLQASIAHTHLNSPTRRTGNEEPFEVSEEEDLSSSEEEPSPYQLHSPVPSELVNVLYPPTKDEQIVNTALIIFLNALTIHTELTSTWTLHRRAFTAKFGEAQFEARTDGYLHDRDGKPSVIIEVKPVLRSGNPAIIQMQESAQMVAWILSDDESAQRRHQKRVHIAQDRHEIYVTVAEYNDHYLAYLKGTDVSSTPPKDDTSFLKMHQYGPWNTLDVAHVRELGKLLLAITSRAEDESRLN